MLNLLLPTQEFSSVSYDRVVTRLSYNLFRMTTGTVPNGFRTINIRVNKLQRIKNELDEILYGKAGKGLNFSRRNAA